MFTGIVQDVGVIEAVTPRGNDLALLIRAPRLPLAREQPGASIAVAGICLTATRIDGQTFSADVSRETLAVTTAGDWVVGQPVNLEPALRAGDPLGGHLVSGHVDGIAEVEQVASDARSTRVSVRVPDALARFVARKGSVTLDGVSLTVNEAGARSIGINLVPHTLAHTTLADLRPGTRLNIEIDLLARYVERLYEMMRT